MTPPLIEMVEEYGNVCVIVSRCAMDEHLHAVGEEAISKANALLSQIREAIERQERELAGLEDALRDMLSGWRYIRATHGDLYGVGWDRAEKKAIEALAALSSSQSSERGEKQE